MILLLMVFGHTSWTTTSGAYGTSVIKIARKSNSVVAVEEYGSILRMLLKTTAGSCLALSVRCTLNILFAYTRYTDSRRKPFYKQEYFVLRLWIDTVGGSTSMFGSQVKKGRAKKKSVSEL